MLRSNRYTFLVGLGIHLTACSSESERVANEPTPNGGTSEPARPAPVFLEESAYADLVTLDPTFPFGVTQVRRADGAIAGSHWGRHGGPLVTTGVYGADEAPSVVQWSVDGEPTAVATGTTRALGAASGLPKTFFYGADGVVDLPFGSLSLLSYTGPAEPYAGEALLYANAYDRVTSRAKANGFYSGTGVENANGMFVVYSGLSPLAKDESRASENGLYAATICDSALLAESCAEPWKLFGWKGQSGPVVTDAHGTVFVAAALASGKTSDAVYAIAKSAIVPGAAIAANAIAEVDTKGTASLAAIAPEDGTLGWVLGLGYDENSAIYAGAFVENDGTLAKSGPVIDSAIARAAGVDGLSVFTDAEGDLWLAVTKGSSGSYVELRRRGSTVSRKSKGLPAIKTAPSRPST